MPFLRSPSTSAEMPASLDDSSPASSSVNGSGSGWFGWLAGGNAKSETNGSSSGGEVAASKPVQHEPKPILVNLGFVPSSLVQPFNLQSLRLPAGEVELEGMLRNEGLGKLSSAKKGKPTSWTPDNDEKGRNWYWVDTERFAEYYRNSNPAGGWGDVEPVLVDVIYGKFRSNDCFLVLFDRLTIVPDSCPLKRRHDAQVSSTRDGRACRPATKDRASQPARRLCAHVDVNQRCHVGPSVACLEDGSRHQAALRPGRTVVR